MGEKETKDVIDDSPFNTERKCTDIICLLLAIAYALACIGILILGMQKGDPLRLVYGYETNGDSVVQCGGEEKKDEKYAVYPRVEEDLLMQADKLSDPFEIDFFGVCVATCPSTGEYVCNTEGETAVQAAMAVQSSTRSAVIEPCLNIVNVPCISSTQSGCCYDSAIAKGCFKTLFDTVGVFYRCIPEYQYSEQLVSATCEEFAIVEDLADASGTCGGSTDKICTNDPVSGWYKESTASAGECNTTAVSTIRYACGKCMKLKTVVQVEETKPEDSSILYDSFNSAAREFDRYMGDLEKASSVVVMCGVGMAFALGLGYVASMYCAAGFMVWASVIGMIIASLLFTIFCYAKAGLLDDDIVELLTGVVNEAGGDSNTSLCSEPCVPQLVATDVRYEDEFRYAAWTMTAVTLVIIVVVIALFGRINRAVGILRIASTGVRQNIGLAILPFVSAAVVLGLFMFWTIASAYIASAGDFSVKIPGTTYELNASTTVTEIADFEALNGQQVVLVYLLFGFLWSYQFVHAFFVISVSGTIGAWYWLGDGHDRRRRPVISSLYTTIRYHLGTIAFGALIVAIVQLVRYIVAYLDHKTKSMQKDSRIMRALFCVLHCCLSCLERCVKFITGNAFIICALYGRNFCSSTKSAFALIVSNAATVATLTFLADIIIIAGQLAVSVSSALIAWFIFENDSAYGRGGDKELSAVWFPVHVLLVQF